MSKPFTESAVEEAALKWLAGLGYQIKSGPEIAPDGPAPERDSYREVVLKSRLHKALARLNPTIPAEALEHACRKVTLPESPSLLVNNRTFHRRLVDGVEVEYQHPEGYIKGDRVKLADFENPDNNDWLAVNQFTVVEGHCQRRPDVVLFVNGLPLAVIELKNPADEAATIWTAFNQLQTYKQQIASLFTYNELLVVSDGLEARMGSLTSPRERFSLWRTIEGEELAPAAMVQLEVLLKGVFHQTRLFDLLRHFIVYEEVNDEIRVRSTKNVVQSMSFAEMLAQTIRRYHNRAIETIQVIEELIGLAKEMREASRRGEDLGLSEEELAFYDALETNDSAVKMLGDETLRTIAQELVQTVRRNVTIDWTVKESVRARLRVW